MADTLPTRGNLHRRVVEGAHGAASGRRQLATVRGSARRAAAARGSGVEELAKVRGTARRAAARGSVVEEGVSGGGGSGSGCGEVEKAEEEEGDKAG